MIHAPSWLKAAAKVALATTMLAAGTGCGALTALTNPKAAWALSEPAPMAVILRRGDAARATATNVDRLMGGTPVDASSRWVTKLVVKKTDVETTLKDIAADPDYVVPPGAKIRVVQAEAWAKLLSDVCPHESKYTSLFASVGPEVESAYGDVTAEVELLASLKGTRDDEQSMIDDKEVSDADKEQHRAKKKEVEELIDKTQTEYRAKLDAFLAKLKEGAGKAPADVKKQMPPVLVALKHAIDDAKLANSVAILRYPMAMPQMPQELKTQAKRIIADAVQDKTGHRPNLDKAEPQVTFEGGEVKLTLAGMPPEALGGLKPDALLDDVVGRTEDYVERVLTFASYVSETQDQLDLEAEIVKAAMEGFEVDESKTSGGDDLSDLKVELDPAGAVTAKGKPGSARRPVPMLPCGKVAPKDDDDDDDDADAADDGGDGDGKDGKEKKAKEGKEKKAKEKGAKKKKTHRHSALKRSKKKSGGGGKSAPSHSAPSHSGGGGGHHK
jgi:hypothetical protein